MNKFLSSIMMLFACGLYSSMVGMDVTNRTNATPNRDDQLHERYYPNAGFFDLGHTTFRFDFSHLANAISTISGQVNLATVYSHAAYSNTLELHTQVFWTRTRLTQIETALAALQTDVRALKGQNSPSQPVTQGRENAQVSQTPGEKSPVDLAILALTEQQGWVTLIQAMNTNLEDLHKKSFNHQHETLDSILKTIQDMQSKEKQKAIRQSVQSGPLFDALSLQLNALYGNIEYLKDSYSTKKWTAFFGILGGGFLLGAYGGHLRHNGFFGTKSDFIRNSIPALGILASMQCFLPNVNLYHNLQAKAEELHGSALKIGQVLQQKATTQE